jgi:alkyl sulfatase BDS1-like metallo-beta-lactamase superfamily hydrolase
MKIKGASAKRKPTEEPAIDGLNFDFSKSPLSGSSSEMIVSFVVCSVLWVLVSLMLAPPR